MEVYRSSYSELPSDPGVYMFLDENGDVIYVGKAKDLRRRVSSYFVNKDSGIKTAALVENIEKIKTITTDSEIESLLLEANLIKKHNPKYNARLTDGKTYIRAKITIEEKIPKVLFARREEDKKSMYFGPFPNSSDLKYVLKLIRKIFPYQSVVNHPKRFCLYYHLGLCPCPPLFQSDQQLKDYKKNIKHIIQFFNGESKKIIKDLEEERNKKSENEEFEEAQNIQAKINAVKSVTSPRRKPFEYELNPNLKSDIRENEIKELLKILKSNGVVISKLERIECYDISNTSGQFATGSMVVFTNGEKDSPSYRRFKIKKPPRVIPNDFAMMSEIIKRRFGHPDWEYPDLIIVDGGKGQITSAKNTISENNIQIPVIGIAKREELLITQNFKVIKLPKNSSALNLVIRIRDEAHRFAIMYHKKIRGKMMLVK